MECKSNPRECLKDNLNPPKSFLLVPVRVFLALLDQKADLTMN